MTRVTTEGRPRRIAIFLPSLRAGGVGRTTAVLANGLAQRGLTVDFLVGRGGGVHEDDLQPGVERIVLGAEPRIVARARILRAHPGPISELARPVVLALSDAPAARSLGPLARYLAARRPDALLAGKTWANLTALWARELAASPVRTLIVEHSYLSRQIADHAAPRWRHVRPLVARAYPRADRIVAVSAGVADDLSAVSAVPRHRIATIHNPLPVEEIRRRSREPSGLPWLGDDPVPVVLAAGRLVPDKDFEGLIEAFRILAERDPAPRLVILGEGPLRGRLEDRVAHAGLGERVALPGHVANPYAAMARARVFALSSRLEGLPGVLLEALACGCPVVSTDCQSGPREILEGGRFGTLVPPGDAEALARALERVLSAPSTASQGPERAAEFAADSAIDRYLRALLEGSEGPR